MVMARCDNGWEKNFEIYLQTQKNYLMQCVECKSSMDPFDNFRKRTKDLRCRKCGTIQKKPNIITREDHIKKKKRTVQTHELWDRYKLIEMIKEYRVKEFTRGFVGSDRVARDCALVAVLFLTGGRISEITGTYKSRKKGESRKLKEYVVEPLRRKNFEFGTINNHKYMEIKNLPVLKKFKRFNKSGEAQQTQVVNLSGKTVKKVRHRSVIIPLDEEADFFKYIKDWLDRIDINPDTPLFPVTRYTGWKISKRLDMNIFAHFFRHMRASDLLNHYGLSEQPVKLFFDWSSTEMVSKYSHVGKEDLLRMMIGGAKTKREQKDDNSNE